MNQKIYVNMELWIMQALITFLSCGLLLCLCNLSTIESPPIFFIDAVESILCEKLQSPSLRRKVMEKCQQHCKNIELPIGKQELKSMPDLILIDKIDRKRFTNSILTKEKFWKWLIEDKVAYWPATVIYHMIRLGSDIKRILS